MPPKISIVITTHGDSRYLPCILSSIENQREAVVGKHSTAGHDVFWELGEPCAVEREVIVVSDGELDDIVEYRPVIDVPRGPNPLLGNKCDYFEIEGYEVDLIKLCPKESHPCGHHTREPGIMAATGDYVVLTNQDNVFMLGWLSLISKHFKPSVGLIVYGGINNLWRYSDRGGVKLKRGFVDLSFVAVRREVAQKVGFPFREYEGDWEYIDACRSECGKRGLEVVKVEAILVVHN